MAVAMKASGCSAKKEAVERGLKLLVRQSRQQAVRKLRGKVKWEGNLDKLRGGK